MDCQDVLQRLEDLASPDKVSYKASKFGISASNALGVYQKDLKVLAKETGYNNELALELFASGIYEARILCSKIFRPEDVSLKLMNEWTATFENWEICDSFCMALFSKNAASRIAKHDHSALEQAFEWTENKKEFVKRAGFVVMAAYGLADKNAGNDLFESFYSPILKQSNDNRVYVKKAINWALRNIGKRNVDLNSSAIKTAKKILEQGIVTSSKSAQWIAKDALREIAKGNIKFLDYPRDIYRPKP